MAHIDWQCRRLAGGVGAVLAGVLACSGVTAAEDWRRWRGPDGNGISTESDWNPKALDGVARILWQASLGEGYASVSISGPHLYSIGNVNDQDIVYGLKADNGQEVWRYAYPCAKGSYSGPRATPVVDEGRLYTLSRAGDLLCLNAADGSLVWRRNLTTDAGAVNTKWGFSSAPVVVGARVIVNAGQSGAAFDKTSGAPAWTSTGTGGYAAAVPYPPAAPTHVALFSQKALLGVSLDNGKVAWTHPWETSYDVNAADPIVAGDRVFLTSGYNRGCALIRVAGGSATPVWENKSLCAQFSSALLIDGFIYGITGNAGSGNLCCLEWETGTVRWSHPLGFGSLIAAGGKLIVLTEKGALVIADAKPDAYHELARAEKAVPLDKGEHCWTSPVLCRGMLYARTSKGTLACIALR